MGCKSSKIAVVDEKNEAWVKSIDQKANKPTSGKKSKRNVFLVGEFNDDKNKRSGSVSSLESDVEGQTRIVGSATSKVSSRTFDSGLGEDYSHVITETSNPVQQKIAEDERPTTPDFTLTGTQIQTRKRSGKTRGSDDILEELQQQGLLLSRPKSRGGLAFEVMLSSDGQLDQRRPPPRLAKLKKKHKKKKQLTKEQLEAKLIAAEERRKAKEQELKEKLAAQISRDKQMEALDAFAESQKKVAEQSNEKVDRATLNREAKMRALQEKAQKRKEHAERVRQMKLQRQAEIEKSEQEQGEKLEKGESESSDKQNETKLEA